MTDATRAQSEQSDVEWLRNLPHVVTSTWQRVVTTATLEKCRAIADALEEALAERKWISAIRKEGPLRRIDELEQQLAASRAENAALAKLADELSVDHRDDDTFDAGVRYALFILGFEKEAVEANDASKALRAGQQK